MALSGRWGESVKISPTYFQLSVYRVGGTTGQDGGVIVYGGKRSPTSDKSVI